MDFSINSSTYYGSPNLNGLDEASLAASKKANNGSSQEEILEVSKKFESVLWKKFLDDALKPVLSSDLTGNSTQSEIYKDMITHSLSKAITEESRSPISNHMAAQLYIDVNKPKE